MPFGFLGHKVSTPRQSPGHLLESLQDKADTIAHSFATALDTEDPLGSLEITARDLRLKYVAFMQEHPTLPRVPFRLVFPKLTKIMGPAGIFITTTDKHGVTWYLHTPNHATHH